MLPPWLPQTAAPGTHSRNHSAVGKLHLRELFEKDPVRGERMTPEAAGIYFDYSKNRITDETLKLLLSARGRVRSSRSD